jgi:hypothetical protein
MRVSWRHFRTDLLGIACLVAIAACLAVFKWPVVVVSALGVALVCAVSPRMKGPFGVTIGGTKLTGTLDDTQKVILKVEISELGEELTAQDQGPPSSTKPPED